MSNSMFDPQTILEATVEGQMATAYPLLPEGEYTAQIVDLVPDTFAQKDQETGMETNVPIIYVHFEIPDADLAATLNLKSFPKVNRMIFLNLTDEGQLDPEKNIILAQIREACGQAEDEGWSPGALMGGTCLIRVSHSDPSKDKQGRTFANISAFAQL